MSERDYAFVGRDDRPVLIAGREGQLVPAVFGCSVGEEGRGRMRPPALTVGKDVDGVTDDDALGGREANRS
jgi:hypothetical protein